MNKNSFYRPEYRKIIIVGKEKSKIKKPKKKIMTEYLNVITGSRTLLPKTLYNPTFQVWKNNTVHNLQSIV